MEDTLSKLPDSLLFCLLSCWLENDDDRNIERIRRSRIGIMKANKRKVLGKIVRVYYCERKRNSDNRNGDKLI